MLRRWTWIIITATGFMAHPGLADKIDKSNVASLLRCDLEMRICLRSVSRLIDRDGDGVSDIDEQVLGTDPLLPLSVPLVSDVLKEAVSGKLPSFATGTSFILFLPTRAPNGNMSVVTSGRSGLGIATIAGLNYPSRNAFMKDMGLTSGLLASLGIDPSNGFSAVSGTVIGGGTKSKLPSGLEVALSRVSVAQVSSGPGGNPVLPEGFPNTRYSNGMAADLFGSDTSYTQRYSDGSKSETIKSSDGVTTTYTDKNGAVEGVARTSNESHQNPGNTTTSSVTSVYETKNDKGTTTTTQTTSSTTDNTTGEVVGTTGVTTTERKNNDNSSTTHTTRTDEGKAGDGKRTTTTVTDTYKDKNGTVHTSSKETKATTDKNQNVTSQQTTSCIDKQCEQTSGTDKYVDPDAQQNTVTVTPELMKRVIAKLKRNSTPAGVGGTEVEIPDYFVGDPTGTAPLILLDPEGGLVTVLSVPHFFNSTKGTENHGPPGSQPGINISDDEYGSEGDVFVNAFENRIP